MIKLYLTNGEILLYNATEWIKLREEHRIIGEIIGNSLHVPSLPIKILPEEACLLLDKKIVTILESPKIITKSASDKRALEEYEDSLISAETVEYKRLRTEQLEVLADELIVKRNNEKSKEEFIKDELKKLAPVTKDNMIWPVTLPASSSSYDDLKTCNRDDIINLTSNLKAAVYSDLWHKGYYITQGHKFGGHFLAYAGDPICHHALFIVRCTDHTEPIYPLDLISFGRLGSSVKKKSVWASLKDNEVSYISTSWFSI